MKVTINYQNKAQCSLRKMNKIIHLDGKKHKVDYLIIKIIKPRSMKEPGKIEGPQSLADTEALCKQEVKINALL